MGVSRSYRKAPAFAPGFSFWTIVASLDTMPRTADNIQIPLSEKQAVRLLGRVKPTDEMPRQGNAKKKKAKKDVDQDGTNLRA